MRGKKETIKQRSEERGKDRGNAIRRGFVCVEGQKSGREIDRKKGRRGRRQAKERGLFNIAPVPGKNSL